MSSQHSVSRWLDALGAGDPEAAQQLWERYFERLVVLARKKLRGTTRRAADEEDVALSAFASFVAAAAKGRFPKLDDRYDLWRLLVVITARKAHHQRRYTRRQKRGGGRVRGESGFRLRSTSLENHGINQVAGVEPTPEFAAIVAEELQRRLDNLGDEKLRQVAVLKMEGYTNDEIAERLGCTVRTVERKLRGIRRIWSQEELR